MISSQVLAVPYRVGTSLYRMLPYRSECNVKLVRIALTHREAQPVTDSGLSTHADHSRSAEHAALQRVARAAALALLVLDRPQQRLHR